MKRDQSSFWNWVIMLLPVTARIRFPLPRRISSARRIPTSMVLPSPTASAIRMRGRGWARACRAGSSWKGRRSMAARWPIQIPGPVGGDCRSRASRKRRVSRNWGEGSGTRVVSAGSRRTMPFPSISERNRASRPRTSSETPVAAMESPRLVIRGHARRYAGLEPPSLERPRFKEPPVSVWKVKALPPWVASTPRSASVASCCHRSTYKCISEPVFETPRRELFSLLSKLPVPCP